MKKISKKNIKLALAVLCSGISIDQRTNNASLFNLIEVLSFPKEMLKDLGVKRDKILGIPIPFSLFSIWHKVENKGSAEADIKIQIVDPAGKKREVSQQKIKISSKTQRLRLTTKWGGIKVSTSGMYTFKISKKEKSEKGFSEAGEIYLMVNLLEKEIKKTKRKK